MIFEPVTLEKDCWISGIEKKTSPDTLYEDLPVLSKEFAKIKPSIKNPIRPLTTCVATGKAKIFMGDFVERKDPNFASISIKKGQLLVKVKVSFRFQAFLPAKVAGIRKKFYQNWLPESGYVSSQWQDLEVYHYRRCYFRKSRKMVMELWFLLENKKED